MSFLAGKRVVITGGTTGIGLATAERFARQGAKVMITGRTQASADRAVAASEFDLIGQGCDLKNMSDLDALAAAASDALGAVDIFFANAGVAHFRPLEEMTEELYDDVMTTNVKGLFFSIQRVVPLMGEGGVIVVTGSIAPRKGQPGLSIYGASKGAARAIVRNLVPEMIEKGIRINCLAPGPVRTAIFSRMAGGDEAQAEAIVDRLAAGVPIGRVGTSEEIAEAVEFMCGPGSAYMMGSEVTLDGGKAEI